MGSVISASPFIATLQCEHDHTTPNGDPIPYVDAGTVLWAHKTTGLSGTTT